jgi:hypothetical protein
MPLDHTNRFMQILQAAQLERVRRRAILKKEREQYLQTIPQPKPEEDKPIGYERREYLHRKVKELLR